MEKEDLGCLLPQQSSLVLVASLHVFSVDESIPYPRCACCSTVDTQAKRSKRAMDGEQYAILINELETTPLQPCEELVQKFSLRSVYN